MNTYKYNKKSIISKTIIALTIVCIIFAICIGTIAADKNKIKTINSLKKAYNDVENAFIIAEQQNGIPSNWELEEGTSPRASYMFFAQYLLPQFKILRDCRNSTEEICSYEFSELNGTTKTLDASWARFFDKNGHFIAIKTNAENKNKVATIYIDINGKSRFNVVGRDIFIFEYWLQNEKNPQIERKLLPFGYEYSVEELVSNDNLNNCNQNQSGNYCSAVILKNKWQITSIYPWSQARYITK